MNTPFGNLSSSIISAKIIEDKGAISEGLRLETSGKIQVTCIYPGAFKTELAFSIKDESMLEALMSRGIGNIAQPAERVAESIIYALQLDPGVSVNEIVIRPTAQEA